MNVWPGTLLWEPFACNAVASACVMVPNWARPARGSASWATTRSWIIQFSYHPDSLLMTFSPAKSAKVSMAALTLLGSSGLPGSGSMTTRMAPMAPLAGGVAVSLMPGICAVKTFG